jgi:hypothetical protein
MTIDPTGTVIAFSALSWTGDQLDDAYESIFACNINGTDVRRVTPLDKTMLQPRVYPQAGVTAINAWQKLRLQKDPDEVWDPKMLDEVRGPRRPPSDVKQ